MLESDERNYNALVFVGVAAENLQQHEQAVAAYRKAVDVDSSQLLAWQASLKYPKFITIKGYVIDISYSEQNVHYIFVGAM